MCQYQKKLKYTKIDQINNNKDFKTDPIRHPHFKTSIPFSPKINLITTLPDLPIIDFYIDEQNMLLITLSENKLITIINLNDSEDSILIDQFTKSEAARTIHLNKIKNSLIIAYLKTEDNCSEIKCTELSLESYKELKFSDVKIDNLHPPSFIEFDEINNKIVTRNSLNSYRVYDLKDYKCLFELNDTRIKEIRTAEEVLWQLGYR
jgi:hypothetical protein